MLHAINFFKHIAQSLQVGMIPAMNDRILAHSGLIITTFCRLIQEEFHSKNGFRANCVGDLIYPQEAKFQTHRQRETDLWFAKREGWIWSLGLADADCYVQNGLNDKILM